MIISTWRNYANARGVNPYPIANFNRKYESLEVEGDDKRQYWKKKAGIITPSYGMRKEERRMNLMKWLLKVSLTAILVSTLTIVTTGVVVNAYIQSILSSLNIQLEAQPLGVGGIMKSMLGFGAGTDAGTGTTSGTSETVNVKDDNQTSPDSVHRDDKEPAVDGTAPDTNGSQEAEETDAGAGETEGTSSGQEAPDGSLPVMGSSATHSEEAPEDEIVMTPGDIVDRKGSLPLEDKEEIFTLLMSKLPQSEMQKISEAMEDGLTEAELTEIEEGITQYLSEAEYDKLISLLQE